MTNSTNAFKLMTLWINKYNKTVKDTRLMAHLQKKQDYDYLQGNLRHYLCPKKTADQIIEADFYKTSTAYVLKTNKPSVLQVNEPYQGEDEGEQDAEDQDEEGIRGRLMESLTNKLNGKPYNPITYIAQDKNNLVHLLLQGASDISREKKQLDAMKDHMNGQKKEFQNTEVSFLIDSLFDSLLIYQLDLNTNRAIDFIDEEKYKEKYKQSEWYQLLKLIWIVIINFERLRAPNATETLFSSNFEMLLTIMFQGHNISIQSGETVSCATLRAAAANDHSTSDFGRRIDVLVHESCYGIRNEYCCIEFKRQDAKTRLLTHQQSKSIRINGAILNDLIAKTNADDIYLIYMDFWGNDGYIAGMKLFENVHLVDQISSIHLPGNLIELEDFRSTIKYLYRWRQHILQHSRNLALGIFKEKRKYETVDISRPSTPICLSPERVPARKPLNMYYSPSKNKKPKGKLMVKSSVPCAVPSLLPLSDTHNHAYAFDITNKHGVKPLSCLI
ncbi:hypothetical protein BDB01DRAFT_850445 [Pilobolus umbonatus]|nr:hypothetical protein BDB01DRAFT_850445 [Pilobolus umbonatus]